MWLEKDLIKRYPQTVFYLCFHPKGQLYPYLPNPPLISFYQSIKTAKLISLSTTSKSTFSSLQYLILIMKWCWSSVNSKASGKEKHSLMDYSYRRNRSHVSSWSPVLKASLFLFRAAPGFSTPNLLNSAYALHIPTVWHDNPTSTVVYTVNPRARITEYLTAHTLTHLDLFSETTNCKRM